MWIKNRNQYPHVQQAYIVVDPPFKMKKMVEEETQMLDKGTQTDPAPSIIEILEEEKN